MQFTPAFWESLPPTILILVVLLVGVYNIVRLISKLIDNTIARMDRMIETVTVNSQRIVTAVDSMEDRLSKKMDHATEVVSAMTIQCALAQSARASSDGVSHTDARIRHDDDLKANAAAVTANAKPIAIDLHHPRIGDATP